MCDLKVLSRTSLLATALWGLAAAGVPPPVFSQPDVSIAAWAPVGTRTPYARVLNVSTSSSDYFAEVEQVSIVKSQNAIYVKFDNSSLAVIPDGAVTVTAHYAEAAPGLSASAAATAVMALPGSAWRDYGNYPMDLDLPPSPPPDWGLFPGTYPTVNELGPGEEWRYRIDCSVDCSQPLPTSFFLRITLSSPPGETDTSQNVAYSYYDESGGVPPADIVILHDVSGSMSSQLAVVQQRAKMFVDLLNAGDRVGVVAFSSQFAPADAQPQNCGSPGVLSTCIFNLGSIHPSDPAKIDAKTAINGFFASGWTPMGEGVLMAQDLLNAVPVALRSSNRAIVLLTDGKENWGTHRLKATGYPIINGPSGLDADGIGLYPLWFGSLSDWGKQLLQDINAETTLGKLVEQPTDDLKLAEAYLMIRGILTHDDVYSIHRGTTGDGFTGTIFVDAVTRELILTAAWRSFGRDLSVEIQPPGTSQWLPAGAVAASTSRDQLYAVHRFQNPPTGLWRYRLTEARPGEEYVLSALADQVEVLMQSSLADYSLSAGEPVVINARLSRGGEPVTGAVVRATVQVPDRALGTLLHQFRGQFQTPSQPQQAPDIPRAAGILAELRKLLGSDQLYQFSANTVTLTDHGDGTYSGRFENTQVAGTYRVTLTAENAAGADADGFRREHRHAAVVSLGPVDPKRSVVTVDRLDRIGPEGEALWRVQVVPADIYGNFADPDYANRIQVDATAGRWVDVLADNDDGSYTRLLELAPGEKASVSVSAFGEKLKEQDVGSGGATAGRRGFSLHAGGSFPTGTFDRFFDPGLSFTLDWSYELRPQWTLLGLAGVHEFPRSQGSSNETVLQLSANLRRRLSTSPLSAYVQAGPGAYRIFSDWEPGANLGLGVTFRASPTVDLEGGVDYHAIFLSGDDARFYQVHTGFSIRY